MCVGGGGGEGDDRRTMAEQGGRGSGTMTEQGDDERTGDDGRAVGEGWGMEQ